MPVTIIENECTYTMDVTYDELDRAVKMFMKERIRLREKCRRRYKATGRPPGRPKKEATEPTPKN